MVVIHVKSGGRRIALYAELGGYFHPDGSLNEPALREFVRGALRPEETSGDRASAWLSSYLDNVLEYLDGKGMTAAVPRLFEVAVDEAAQLGVDKVTLGPDQMRNLLSAAVKADASSPRKHAADEKKKRIMDCALKVFTERGFHQVTMDEIAAAAGVAKGTIYCNFKSKEDLLEQLLLATSEKILERFSGAFTGKKNVLEEIQEFIEGWLGFIEENHALYRLIQVEGVISPSGKRTVFYEYVMAGFPMVKERLASLNVAGELKTVSFHTVAYGMLGFIDGVVNKWFRSGMDYPLRDEIPTILEVLFNGLARERHPAGAFFVPPEEQAASPKSLQPRMNTNEHE